MKSNKRGNIKLVIAILFMMLVIMTSGVVKAKTYDITEENISVVLGDEYIDIFTEYTENQDKLSEMLPSSYYSTFIKNNKAQGAVLDAVKLDENNEMLTEILVSVTSVNDQEEIRDFKDYDKTKMEQYKKAFVQSLTKELKTQLSTAQVNEDELFTANNGDVYIKIHANISGQESDIFYTVKNYKLIGINIRYLDGNRDLEMAKSVINQVTIKDTTSQDKKTTTNKTGSTTNNSIYGEDTDTKNYTQLTSSIVFLAIVLSTIISSRKASKNETITDQQKGKFKVFGGFLIVYVVAVIINIILQALTALGIQMLSAEVVDIITMIQAVVTTIMIICILVFIFIKNKKTPSRIRKILYAMLAVNIIMGIAKIGYSFIDEENTYSNIYYIAVASEIIGNISYTLIWTTYFAISKRVRVYYGIEDSTEEIVNNEVQSKEVETKTEVVEVKEEIKPAEEVKVEEKEDNKEE